jgi:hypothetical protein
MNGSRDIDAQVTLPMELYQAIAQRAQVHGYSVSQEIVARLLTLYLFSGFLFMQFLIVRFAFMTTVLSLDPPKSPLKMGTLRNFPVPPFLMGLGGIEHGYCMNKVAQKLAKSTA